MSQTPPPGTPPPPPEGQTPPQGYPPQQPQPLTPDEERLWSVLSHLSFFVLGIIVPLIVMLTLGTRSAYVRHHAVEALNFHITVWIASVIAGLAIIVIIGLVLLPAVLVVGAVFAIIAAVQSYQGVLYRYPLTLRLVS
jgi:uncharacterized protein